MGLFALDWSGVEPRTFYQGFAAFATAATGIAPPPHNAYIIGEHGIRECSLPPPTSGTAPPSSPSARAAAWGSGVMDKSRSARPSSRPTPRRYAASAGAT